MGLADSVIVVIGAVFCWSIVVASWGEGEAWVCVGRRMRERRGRRKVRVSIDVGVVGVLMLIERTVVFVLTALEFVYLYCAIDSS